MPLQPARTWWRTSSQTNTATDLLASRGEPVFGQKMLGQPCSRTGDWRIQSDDGCWPLLQAVCLNNFAGRLAEHGLIDAEPNLNRQMALREAARIAMVRMHFSQSIRKAELARSREPTTTMTPQPGDVVYFWRTQKQNRRGDPRLSTSSRRRRLELRRWHGPAILLCLEHTGEDMAPSNAFLSFKGQVTNVA